MSRAASADRGRAHWLLRLLPLALPLLLFVGTGVRGLDFGQHWDDEDKAEQVLLVAQRGNLLPRWYHYPSVTHWLCLGAMAPEYARAVERNERGHLRTRVERVQAWLESGAFVLRSRAIFLACTALTLVWVYLLVLRWRGGVLEALLASSLLATSWEFAYHARWIAPDGPLLQFATLCVLLLFCAQSSERAARWLAAAAVAAGLACGSKYTGGLLLFFVWIEGARLSRAPSWAGRLRELAGLSALFALSYLCTTPGTLLEPLHFYEDVRFEIRHYAAGHMAHQGFAVEPGWEHLSRALRYLGFSLGSPAAPLALALCALALAGAAATWRDSRALFFLLVGLPLAYLLLMSRQRLLFVRNLLFVAPFGALLAARGCALVGDLLRAPRARLAWGAGLLALLGWQAAWLIAAAEGIRERGGERYLVELRDYVAAHPATRFQVSAGVRADLREAGIELPRPDAPEASADARLVVTYPEEMLPFTRWPSNRPGLAQAVFGPLEVNFEYYTSWIEPRILVLSAERHAELRALRAPSR